MSAAVTSAAALSNDLETEEKKLAKIDIISGFLGAGKTTLIKKLIEEAFKGEKLVLIENEFGEIGIDGGFLKDAGVQINEMNSGCICCSLVGDFGEALKQVVADYAPDRIIIEPSGVGKLSDVIKAVQKAAETVDIELNSATTVVDVTKAKMYIKNFGEFFLNQIEACGTVVLSRTQSAAEDKLLTAVDMIKEHNAEARIITTPWDDIAGTVILDAIEHSSNVEDIMKNFKYDPEEEVPMKYLQAGEERQLTSIHAKSWKRSSRSLLLRKIMNSESSSELRESSLIRIITGLSSILYRVSTRSVKAQLITQESSVLSEAS